MRDSKREFFYDDIAHVIQNTKKKILPVVFEPEILVVAVVVRYTTKACGRLAVYATVGLNQFIYAYYSSNRANCKFLLA